MGSSAPDFISDITKMFLSRKPKSILDIGIGFGKWGFLAREYCDSWYSRVDKDKWSVKIDGIEVWERNITDAHRYIYSNIFIEDVVAVFPSLDVYDMIIACDVIEHLKKEDSIYLLNNLKNKTRGCIILSIPLGKRWLQRPSRVIKNNPYDDHLSWWTEKELNNLGYTTLKKVKGVKGEIGLFTFSK